VNVAHAAPVLCRPAAVEWLVAMMAFPHLSRRLWLPCAASDIEPDRDGFWWADMGPIDGPVLGPFRSRTEALGAERGWLLGCRHLLQEPSDPERLGREENLKRRTIRKRINREIDRRREV